MSSALRPHPLILAPTYAVIPAQGDLCTTAIPAPPVVIPAKAGIQRRGVSGGR